MNHQQLEMLTEAVLDAEPLDENYTSQGSNVGKLMYLAENLELASFTATLEVSDNLFGYTLTGLDVI